MVDYGACQILPPVCNEKRGKLSNRREKSSPPFEAQFGAVKGKRMLFNIIEKKLNKLTNFRDKLQFVNSVKRLVFDLTKIPFLKCLSSTYRLIVKVINSKNLFTESNLDDWFSSYVWFHSGGHFSERAAAAQ